LQQRYVYLADGDGGGRHHEKALKDVGVDAGRIFRLPEGHAVEDLIHPDDYIATVNRFLEIMGQGERFTDSDSSPGTPIAKGFKEWAKASKVRIPGKVEVAYALLQRPSLRLTPSGKKALLKLHHGITEAFAVDA
jgi:hypothetical protein